MNYNKITFNKIAVNVLWIITTSLCASEHYNSNADAHTRRTLIHRALQQKNNTAHELEDLNLRSAVLDKNLTQVQALLTRYDRDVMCYKIVDDAQASLDEISLSSTIKKPALEIATGTVLTTAGAALLCYGDPDARAVTLTGLIGSVVLLGHGISRVPSALQSYHEFCKKYPKEQRAAAIVCAQKIKELINNYKSKQKD